MAAVEELATGTMQELARKHLWMHFTRMGAFDAEHEIPIIVRGEGCYVYDQHGRRFLDGLSALYCVNIGHGRADVAQAGADQAQAARLLQQLGLRAPEGDRARRARRRPRARDAQPRLLHLRRLGGRRLGAEALPPVPQADRQRRPLQGDLAQARLSRHDDGRAHRDGHPGRAAPVRAAVPRLRARRQHQPVPARGRRSRRGDPRADRVRGARDRLLRDPRAGAELRRLLHAARGLLPARARDLRRVRDPVHLRRGDLLVGTAGRVLRRRALRLRARHHHDGQGPDLLLRPDGRGDRLRQGVRAVRRQPGDRSCTGSRSAVTRWRPRSRSPTSTCSSTSRCSSNVRSNEAAFGAMLDSLRDIPIVGDVRGMGYFWAIELVRDRATKQTFSEEECELAAARLPLRRDLQARADLPRRRPRRPGDPARAAADRRARSSSRRSAPSCDPPSRRPRGGWGCTGEKGARAPAA